MKKSINLKTIVFLLVVVMLTCLVLTACKEETPKQIYLTSKSQTLSANAGVKLTITVPEGEDYDIEISDPSLVAFNEAEGMLYVVGSVTEAKEITVTVSLVSNPEIKASKNFTVMPTSPIAPVVLSLVADKYVISDGDPALITITSPNNEKYVVTVSDTSIVNYKDGVLRVIEEPDEETTITVTVTLESNPQVKASKTFTVKAKEIAPTLKLRSDVAEIADVKDGEAKNKAQLTVETSIPGVEYELSVSSDVIKINDDLTVEIVGEVLYDTRVSVTVRLKNKKEVTSTISLILRALQVEGSVQGANGLVLTTDMINTFANASITAEGKVIDVIKNYSEEKADETSYDISVKMSDGRWIGSWKISGRSDATIITDMYVRGVEQIKYAYDKSTGTFSTGTEMLKVYIGKDNTVVRKRVTDSYSIPVAWENQHLYNPAEHFATNVTKKFEYREDFILEDYGYDPTEYAAFRYKLDETSIDELYFATYLSFAFTPMVSDTLVDIYLIVGANGIEGMVATSQRITYGGTDNEGTPIEGEDPTGETYTVIDVRFSGVGTTTVDDPTPYVGKIENPSNLADTMNNLALDALKTALEKMRGATNYTFRAVDTTTYSPGINEGDYDVSGAGYSASNASSVGNSQSSTGTVGTVGKITEDAILLVTTDKYSASMDDKLYHTESTGYKKVDDTSYEYFEYSYDTKSLAGKTKIAGNMADIIPQFMFAPDIFKYKSNSTIEGTDIMAFELVLRDVTIAKDIAPELSMYRYAKNADSDVGSSFSVWVDENGNLIKSVYQYSISYGTYLGYVTTVYSDLGTTALPADAFDGYVAREQETSWSQYTDTSFYKLHTTLCKSYGCQQPDGTWNHAGHTGTGEDVLKFVFGEEVDMSKIPTPTLFFEIFGDNLYRPGYDWNEKTQGDVVTYIEHFDFTLAYDRCDENAKIYQEDYDNIIAQLKTKLGALGFTFSESNSNVEKNVLEGGSRYATFNNGDTGVQIVIENNFTRYFWVSMYNIGDWTLSR
ncbi:MAG: hypothetical protein ACI4SK_00165 [Christensenellales bacterium]